MQDHPWFTLAYPVDAATSSSLFTSLTFIRQNQADFVNSATGIYSNPGTEAIGWEKVPTSLRTNWTNSTVGALNTYPVDWPELEYLTVNSYVDEQEVYTLMDPRDGTQYASLGVILITPESRGTVTITSADASVAPAIDPQWFTNQADMDVMVAGFKRARAFWATDALQNFTTGAEKFPGLDVVSSDSDADIEAFIRRSFNTLWHAACTCAMGTADDANAVVDPQAQVIGVTGLRVVDASAFPILPPGHPQSTVYALAEKIACDISGAC